MHNRQIFAKYCQICGKKIEYLGRGRPPLYCITCFNKMREEYLREYWKKNKDRYADRVKARLGTTDFSPHMARDDKGNPDWERELEEIQEEMKKLGLRKRL